MNTQKLSDHLKSLCQDQPEYANLQATWLLNKHTCSDALKSVVINYPHFSMHDASHAEAVISKMEMLLGERIHTLSPTDTWLLLHAAYTHDLGMILSWEQMQRRTLPRSMRTSDSVKMIILKSALEKMWNRGNPIGPL